MGRPAWDDVETAIERACEQTGKDGGCSNFTVESFRNAARAAVEPLWVELADALGMAEADAERRERVRTGKEGGF